jgi:hypothetical protein
MKRRGTRENKNPAGCGTSQLFDDDVNVIVSQSGDNSFVLVEHLDIRWVGCG